MTVAKQIQNQSNISKLNSPVFEDTPDMKALIIYGDFVSADYAREALQNSARNANCSARWNLILWQVDLLKSSPAAEQALGDASDAHLLVLAGRSAHSLPWWLQAWLERWAECRLQDAALAVFDLAICEQNPPIEMFTLQNFAKWHGLSLIYDASQDQADGQRPLAAPSLELHAAILHVMLRPPEDTGGYDAARHLGANK